MRSFIIPAMVLLTFSSCSTYQYVTLDSPQAARNAKKELSWENDTMRVNYNFKGEGGPVTIEVFNKTDKPLYVNWNKSAIIRDGRAINLISNSAPINGQISSVGGRHASFGSFSGQVDLPEGMNLLPPGSGITRTLDASIDRQPLESSYFPDSIKAVTASYPDGAHYKYKRYTFAQQASPLQFRSFLTFVLGYNNSIEFSVSHDFFANEVVLTKENPTFFASQLNRGDKMYIKTEQ